MNKHYKGSCLCGAVTFNASGFSEQAAHCHCNMCKKFHGAAFGTLVAVEQFEWLSGDEFIKEFKATNGTVRTFCSQCGSSLGFHSKDSAPDSIEIAISTFDEKLPINIDAHIYANYKAHWMHLDDSLPIFDEVRDSNTD
ncbi:GFA family protein [Sessilibacter corallicola]|uniref:GFA family protein n=1 Tax=Sessilibacter corallicola TaxID=2904075 RepID=A0ABQ0A8C7_9GAMM